MMACETISCKFVNTRKVHRCVGCYEKFPAGSFMQYWAGTVEGDFQSNYWCPSCLMFARSRLVDAEDIYPGEIPTLKEEIAPEMFEDYWREEEGDE